MTIRAGQASAAVTIDPNADPNVEPDETVKLTLVSGSGYSLGAVTAASGTILNDDVLPEINLYVDTASVAEDGPQNLVFRVTQSKLDSGFTVNFALRGTADYGTDYSVSGVGPISGGVGSFVWPGGSVSSVTVEVIPVGDVLLEPDETVEISLLPGSEYTIGTSPFASGTIRTDERPPEDNGNGPYHAARKASVCGCRLL